MHARQTIVSRVSSLAGRRLLSFFLGNAQEIAYLCAMVLYAVQLRPQAPPDLPYLYPDSLVREHSQAVHLAAEVITQEPYRSHYDAAIDALIGCVYDCAVKQALDLSQNNFSSVPMPFPKPTKDGFHYEKCSHLSEEIKRLAKRYVDSSKGTEATLAVTVPAVKRLERIEHVSTSARGENLIPRSPSALTDTDSSSEDC